MPVGLGPMPPARIAVTARSDSEPSPPNSSANHPLPAEPQGRLARRRGPRPVRARLPGQPAMRRKRLARSRALAIHEFAGCQSQPVRVPGHARHPDMRGRDRDRGRWPGELDRRWVGGWWWWWWTVWGARRIAAARNPVRPRGAMRTALSGLSHTRGGAAAVAARPARGGARRPLAGRRALRHGR
jgi:hypothetical protein